MKEYEYDYKQILQEIEKSIFDVKKNTLDELAGTNEQETIEVKVLCGIYRVLDYLSECIKESRIKHRKELKNESKIND